MVVVASDNQFLQSPVQALRHSYVDVGTKHFPLDCICQCGLSKKNQSTIYRLTNQSDGLTILAVQSTLGVNHPCPTPAEKRRSHRLLPVFLLAELPDRSFLFIHVPEFQNQLYSFYLTYKRTVHEFFWSLSGSYWNQKNQQLTHSEYRDSIFFLTTWEVPNHNRSYSLTSLLSKGFYNWNLKTSLETQLIHSEGKQAGQGSIQNYCYTQLVLTPKINWTPLSWLNTSYLASLTCNRSLIGRNNNLPALWNIRQQIYLEIGNSTYQIRLTGEHYYNQLDENHHQHVWLADAETSYIKNKWRFSMSLCNLFNQKEYRYTTYSAIQQYTSWIKMRPREILVSIQYQL